MNGLWWNNSNLVGYIEKNGYFSILEYCDRELVIDIGVNESKLEGKVSEDGGNLKCLLL